MKTSRVNKKQEILKNKDFLKLLHNYSNRKKMFEKSLFEATKEETKALVYALSLVINGTLTKYIPKDLFRKLTRNKSHIISLEYLFSSKSNFSKKGLKVLKRELMHYFTTIKKLLNFYFKF